MARIIYKKPKCRKDCEQIERPCPFIACRHHLEDDYWTCVLDLVQEVGDLSIEKISELLGMSRERVRQVEQLAVKRFKSRWGLIVRDLRSPFE